MDIEKLTTACEHLELAVAELYEADENDTFDLGFGFADTTAECIRKFIGKYEKRMAWLNSPAPVTGYLLELHVDGKWIPYEFDPCEKTNLYTDYDGLYDKFREGELHIGMYKALPPSVWVNSSDDWGFRLGADFDSRSTPDERPSPINVWGDGIVQEEGRCHRDADLWRVTKVTIDGTLSERAKKFFAENINVTWETNCK